MASKAEAQAQAEAPWQSISRRKLATQRTALHVPPSISITVPPHLLPTDPPLPSHGKQPVHQIPATLLSSQDNHITSLAVPELLAAIRNGSLTATAVTSAYIRRASLAHQLTNCLTEPLFTRALDHAARLDAHFERNSKDSGNGNPTRLVGPLHGLPVSIKDTFHIAGVDTTLGLASQCFKPATHNAPLVDLLESLGCVILAKTNLPQTIASLDSVNNVFGRTYNPVNRLLTAGGSSGGEGVMVRMRGCAVGFGTDIGGSIRVPAMCNGVFGFKPSVGRLPYGGQRSTGLEGMGRASVQAVAGPIGRSVEDLKVVMAELGRCAWMFGGDCLIGDGYVGSDDAATVAAPQNESRSIPRPLVTTATDSNGQAWKRAFRGSGPNGEFVIGILRSDGNCQLLPPVQNVLDEVAAALKSHTTARPGLLPRSNTSSSKIKVVEVPTPKAWTQAQGVVGRLMGADGDNTMSRMILETDEPLVPWMATRFKHGVQPAPLARVAELQAQRSQIDLEMARDVWMYDEDDDDGTGSDKVSSDSPLGAKGVKRSKMKRTVDALICPVAAHPVPEIDRWNAVGYTSSWVLLDYPAGVVPVRDVEERDLELGRPLDKKLKVLGSWDRKNRELWDEALTDRRVYLGSPLSVQCVTARLEDEKLAFVMGLVDEAVRGQTGGRESKL